MGGAKSILLKVERKKRASYLGLRVK